MVPDKQINMSDGNFVWYIYKYTSFNFFVNPICSTGSDFGADGRLHDMWEVEPKAFLREKSNCVAKQYSDNFRKILPFYQTHVPIQVTVST